MLQRTEFPSLADTPQLFCIDRPQPGTADVPAMIDLYRNEAAMTYKKLAPNDMVAAARIDTYFAVEAADLTEDITYAGTPFWVVRRTEDGQVVGMAGYEVDDEMIHSVYMGDDYRGKGLGKMLLGRLLQEIPHPQPVLMVATANVSSVRFYENLGFTFTGSTRQWDVSTEHTIYEAEMLAPRRPLA